MRELPDVGEMLLTDSEYNRIMNSLEAADGRGPAQPIEKGSLLETEKIAC
jgi:hypothetical protein